MIEKKRNVRVPHTPGLPRKMTKRKVGFITCNYISYEDALLYRTPTKKQGIQETSIEF